MHPTWFYILSLHLKPTRPADPPYHLTQTLQPLDEGTSPHPTRLDDLAVFAAPYTILVANAPIQTRILIRVDAAHPRADELGRIDHDVDLL
jgi:hypothetical protein